MLKFRLAWSLLLFAEVSEADAGADAVLNFHVLFHLSEEHSSFSAFYLVSEKWEIFPLGSSTHWKFELSFFSSLTSQATSVSFCSFESVLAWSAWKFQTWGKKRRKRFDLLSQISGDVRFPPEMTIFPEPLISIKTRGMCCVSAVLIVAAPLAQLWLSDGSIPGLCNSWGLILGTSLAVFLGTVASAPGTAVCSQGVCPAQWSLQSRFCVLIDRNECKGWTDHRKELCCPNRSMVLPHS